MNRNMVEDFPQNNSPRRTEEETIQAFLAEKLLNGSNTEGSLEFLEKITRNLAQELKTDALFIACSNHPENTKAKIILWYQNDQFSDSFEYDVKNSPCMDVLNGMNIILPHGVASQYPESPLLKRIRFEAYAGVPLHNSQQSITGFMGALFRQSLADPGLTETFLQFCVMQVSAELERIHIEQHLSIQENRYESILETCPEAILFHNGNAITYCNSSALNLLKAPSSESILGKSLSDFNFPILPSSIDPFPEIKTSPVFNAQKFRLNCLDGSELEVEMISQPVYFRKKPHYQIILRDITHWVEEISTLRKSEEKYKLLVEYQTELVIKVDRNNNIVFASPSYCETFGKSEEELLGKTFLPLVYEEDRTRTILAMESLYKPPYTCYVEQRAFTTNGWRWFAWSDRAILDEYNTVIEIVGVGRDITDRKKAEIELLRAKIKAEESDRLKTAFLANMSHEIRTPMNSILGFSNLLGRDNLPAEKRKQYIEIIQNGTKQLLTVINDIIDIAKIEAGQISLTTEPFDLNAMLRQFKIYLESEKRIRSKTQLEIIAQPSFPDSESVINTDGIRLQQILTNLLSNAIKFTERGHIRFGYQPTTDNFLMFFVEDTGKGISADKKELIFQRFRQEEETSSREYGGTGLGLSICKGLIDLFKGKLWVDASPGKGASFYFTIPFTPVVSEPAPSVKTDPDLYNWSGKTILIAEDTESNFHFISELLSETSCSIIWAINGKEAIEKFSQNQPIHLILMDIQMPVINGYEATRQIRAVNQTVPIIAQTAYAMAEDRRKCMEAGCNEYIAKPFDRQNLLKLLDHFL